ncbi:hypothetical protein CRYUN_Cryun03dG0051100 [Craigia yunnanensis]
MLSILCVALDSSNMTVKAATCVSPLISGLSEVFLSIRRRHFEQIKVAVPVIVKEDGVNEKLRALLGLYVLQILVGALMLNQSSRLEDEDDCTSFSSHVYLGASLSVIWVEIYDEIARAAKEDLSAVKTELQNNQLKRWQAIGMLKHIFSSVDIPWEFKRDAIDFFLYITSGDISNELDDEHNDCSFYMTSLFSVLQAVTMIIKCASDTVLRKKSFEALKRVLVDIPNSQRFDILKALIIDSDSSSMVAILLDFVREEMHRESTLRTSTGKNEVREADNKACQNTLFWSTSILELTESVLRPVKGGPPVLPENSDAVLSALNLYRFVLMTESAGGKWNRKNQLHWSAI